MDSRSEVVHVGLTDPAIHTLLTSVPGSSSTHYTLHFNQNEEFFILMDQAYEVPSLPIHHDVRQSVASRFYSETLQAFLHRFLPNMPPFFQDLTYFFDPSQILKPSFYKIYRVEQAFYLYILRIDLTWRPLECDTLQAGDNDMTSRYRSHRLYLESEVIPLEALEARGNTMHSFTPKQFIQHNWLGETGRGYMVRGIWIDTELSKLLTRLVVPSGTRHYPFYPLMCKYRSICLNIPDPLPERRKVLLPYLHRLVEIIKPSLPDIESSLKNQQFKEELPSFQNLRKNLPPVLAEPWKSIRISAYLNKNDQKEYQLEFYS